MIGRDFRLGDTVVVRSRVALAIPHLHILLTAPEGDPSTAIVVHITSFEPGACEDPTVILNGGEHPFMVHPSYVWYA